MRKIYGIITCIAVSVGVVVVGIVAFNHSTITPRNDKIYYEPSGKEWEVRLAQTQKEREKGLMFVKNMPDNQGMLFQFKNERIITMWMKNTFILLDMIFIDANGKIVHIHENATPHSLQTISSVKPARYVLEINGGQAKKNKMKINEYMIHPWFQHR